MRDVLLDQLDVCCLDLYEGCPPLDKLDVCCLYLYEGCPPGSVRCPAACICMRDVLLDQLDQLDQLDPGGPVC